MKALKSEKGKFGYINRQRVIEIVKTIFMFSCAIGLYLIGYMTLKTNKNLWTILAVLSILPASKSAVSMIMFLRFSSISSNEYELIEDAKGNIATAYEFVFTSSEKAFYVKAASCAENTIIVLLDNKNKKDLSKELREHILAAIQREGLNGYSLKVYSDVNEYCKRLNEMNNNLNPENDYSYDRIFALFKAITI